MPYFPSGDQVIRDWLRALNLDVDGVATTLPGDPSTWREKGFVQASLIGGSPDRYLPVMDGTVQIDCWANAGSKPPWNMASAIAQTILQATYNKALFNTEVTISEANFYPVHVSTVTALTIPLRIRSGFNVSTQSEVSSGFARYQFDALVRWTVPGT